MKFEVPLGIVKIEWNGIDLGTINNVDFGFSDYKVCNVKFKKIEENEKEKQEKIYKNKLYKFWNKYCRRGLKLCK